MSKEKRIIKIPVVKGVDPYEVTVATLLLSNKFGGVSKTNRYLLEDEYDLPRRFKADLLRLIKEVHNKGLVDVINIDEIDKKSKTIKAVEVKSEDFVEIDFRAIERILLTDRRIDVRVAAIHALILIAKKSRTRNELAKEVGVTRQSIYSTIEFLEELDLIKQTD